MPNIIKGKHKKYISKKLLKICISTNKEYVLSLPYSGQTAKFQDIPVGALHM
jgi:hypothetical protein